MIHFVGDPRDPRLDDYRDIRDRRLREAGGKFVAESEVVVRKLLASGLGVHSVLLTAARLATLTAWDEARAASVLGSLPVYVAPQHVLDQVAGLHVHRGCLAVGQRPEGARVPDGARAVVALEDLVDVDNLGALARSAAGLGADALLLSPRSADPYYRKAIRVSAGAVFALPIVRSSAWREDLLALHDRGFALIGAVAAAAPDERPTPIAAFEPPTRFVLLLGSEGPGLAADTRRLCDALVTVPMRGRLVDSLNVATAGAVLLDRLLSPKA